VSLGGMGLYFAMLARGTAARVSANFYLVPGTAALLAWIILGEHLTLLAMTGLVVASAGCWLVSASPRAGRNVRSA
jgi:drug/metabolite transporter (DMT)-like permease